MFWLVTASWLPYDDFIFAWLVIILFNGPNLLKIGMAVNESLTNEFIKYLYQYR